MTKLITIWKTMVLLVAAVAVFANSTAATAAGLPVMQEGIVKADLFADRIDAAVAVKADGTAPIKGGSGGFYRPIDVWRTLATYHPELGFTKSNPGAADFKQMTTYIRTLELVPLAEGGRYFNSRIDGKTGKLDLEFQRDLPKGTLVYADRNTGVAIFKKNCANGLKLIVDCVYVDFELRDPVEIAATYALFDGDGGDCWAFRQTKAIGEADSPSAAWVKPVQDNCMQNCTLDGPIQLIGKQPVRKGRIALKPGTYQFRLARGHRLSICISTSDPANPGSWSSIARWNQDYQMVNGGMHARIYWQTSEIPKSLKVAGPKWLVFWPSSEAERVRLTNVILASR